VILADTSLWIEQLRRPNGPLTAALDAGLVVIHPFVIGELACGHLRNRRTLLELWSDLGSVPTATDDEALRFIERHALAGTGLGYIDIHLLASTALVGDARLWTHDRPLAAAATRLNLAHDASR
jgi:predicted nucleic acid-binding protein